MRGDVIERCWNDRVQISSLHPVFWSSDVCECLVLVDDTVFYPLLLLISVLAVHVYIAVEVILEERVF